MRLPVLLLPLLGLWAGADARADSWQALEAIRAAAAELAVQEFGAAAGPQAQLLDSRLRLQSCKGPLQAVTSSRSATGMTASVSCAEPAWSVYVPVRLSKPAPAQARLIRRGELVTLLSRGGAIEVRAQGKALGDGALGDSIQVQNSSSGRVVGGVVRAAGQVEVNP